jgi:glycosyltransferase involved in cell wall biosynthesis
MTGRVSIVVAVLDGSATLQRCLDSIAGQDHPDKELIVIDGGSTDGTLELLEKNEKVIAHWETASDRGIYSAWNKALERATGRWICFVGADDYYLDPSALTDMAALGEAEDADLVCGKVWYVDDRGERQFIHGRPWSWDRMKRRHSVSHTGMLHHSRLFERHGRFDEGLRIAGDYEFLLRLGPGARAAFLDRAYLAMGNAGVSTSNSPLTMQEVRRVQAAHPEIGHAAAWLHFSRSLAEHAWWSARRTVDHSPVVCALKTARNRPAERPSDP